MSWEKKHTSRRVSGGHPENRLQQARIRSGITQEQAAEGLCCDVRTLQRYEAGEKFPPQNQLLRMMELYHCGPADLFPA